MADNPYLPFNSRRDIERIIETVLHKERTLKNPPVDPPKVPDNQLWWPFTNDGVEDIEAYDLVSIVGGAAGAFTNGAIVYSGERIGVTFNRLIAVNGPLAVPVGSSGMVTFRGPAIVRFDDSGTPEAGDSWGPKPSEGKAFKDFPGCLTVVSEYDDAKMIAEINPIDILLCKAVGAQVVGTINNTDYKIWTGALTGGADSGFEGPELYLQRPLEADEFFLAYWVNSRWVVPKGGGGGSTWHALAAADIAAGAAGNVTLPDTSIGTAGVVSATNWSDDVDIVNGDKIEVWQDAYDDLYYAQKGGVTSEEITVVTDYRYDSTLKQLQKKTRTCKVIQPSVESAWTLVHEMAEVEITVDSSWSEATLAFSRKLAWIMEAGDIIATEYISFTQKTIVQDVFDGGSYLGQTTFVGYVLTPSSTSSSTVIAIATCS